MNRAVYHALTPCAARNKKFQYRWDEIQNLIGIEKIDRKGRAAG